MFEEFQIMQAPASTFKIPIVSGQITVLAVSERTPTYYDFCLADASCNTCCWCERDTFPGIQHSGDIYYANDLLDYVKIDKNSMTKSEICVFISGYNTTQITRFLGTNPALLVADHVEKVNKGSICMECELTEWFPDSLHHTSTIRRSDNWRCDYLLPVGNQAG